MQQIVDVSPQTRALLLIVRQACLMIAGGIEVYLGLPRTKEPKHKLRAKR